MLLRSALVVFFALGVTGLAPALERPWPVLPVENSTVEVPAQEWPFQPGPRTVKTYLHYPGGSLANVNAETGLFLSLHNWGGTHATGAPDPDRLANDYNTIAICVDYLQSGPYDAATMPPYDFGYLQALDALRALYWVRQGLIDAGFAYNNGRIYAAGGSGGGNVSLMANKLAPRTFAAVVDLSGMAKLTYDMAFGHPNDSGLDAGYSRDCDDPRYLNRDAYEIRDIGFPAHLATMKALGNEARIVTIHGAADKVCPIRDKRRMARNMAQADLDIEAHFVTLADLNAGIFKDTGHSLGNRTVILNHVTGDIFQPRSATAAIRRGPTDFERREIIRYATRNGAWEISYEQGWPVGRFVAQGK